MPPAVWRGCQHACVCDRQRERELIAPTPYSGGCYCTGVNRCYELNCSQCEGYTTLAAVCVFPWGHLPQLPVRVTSQGLSGLARPSAEGQPVKDRGEDTDWKGQDGRKRLGRMPVQGKKGQGRSLQGENVIYENCREAHWGMPERGQIWKEVEKNIWRDKRKHQGMG